MMSHSVYPERFGSVPVEWVAYYGQGVCDAGVDLRSMHKILYLDSTGDPRVSVSGPCGACGSERFLVVALAVDAYGGSMPVCLRCLDQSGVLCEHCHNALVVGEAQTWVEVWGETPKPEALLAVCERCMAALEREDGGY